MPEDLVTKGVLASELKALEQRMTIRLGGGGFLFITAVVSIATAVILEAN